MFHRTNIFRAELERTVAHGGTGEVLTRRVVDADAVQGSCHFMDYTVMPPGSTIGRHTHAPTEEEYYLILAGTGVMSCGEESFPVAPGDLIRNPPGGTHGLQNTGATALCLFVLEVGVPR